MALISTETYSFKELGKNASLKLRHKLIKTVCNTDLTSGVDFSTIKGKVLGLCLFIELVKIKNMPYYPGIKLKEKIEGLAQGFMLESQPKLAICIKLEPSLIDSIISGCLIELSIVKSTIRERSILLLIEDIPGQPFFVLGERLTKESEEFSGYDLIVENLLTSEDLILGLFNLNSQSIYSRVLNLFPEGKLEMFRKWVNEPPSPSGNLMNLLKEDVFTINLNNLDNTEGKDVSFVNIQPHDNFSSGPDFLDPLITTDNLIGDGKHGYTQEGSIRNLLLNYWVFDKNIFFSPKKDNGNELIDSVLLLPKSLILIESKYVISTKTNKKTGALKKAIKQLNTAEAYLQKDFLFRGVSIAKHTFIQICLVDIRMLNLLKEMKIELGENFIAPLFFTMTTFTQLIGKISIDDRENFESIFEHHILKLWNGRNQKQITIR